MNLIMKGFDFFINLDVYLNTLVQHYGILVYPLVFIIIFLETGTVIAPILPGDSLLFVAGTIAAIGSLNIWILFLILAVAAILGDSFNYAIGKYFGPKIFRKEKGFFFKKEYLTKTEDFYERHGGKTIIIARFMPIVRTFAPFVAGMGKMYYPRFLLFNVIGGISWTALFLFAGYFFGNIEFVKHNLTIFILLIVFISMLPGIIAYIRNKLKK